MSRTQRTHILDHTTMGGMDPKPKTLCGKPAFREGEATAGAFVDARPHNADCWTCRKKRDNRS